MSTGRLVVLILLIVFLSMVTIAVATFIFLAGTIVDEEDGTATTVPTSEIEYQDQTRVNN
jgi:flagellar basal body-associated protein FliL